MPAQPDSERFQWRSRRCGRQPGERQRWRLGVRWQLVRAVRSTYKRLLRRHYQRVLGSSHNPDRLQWLVGPCNSERRRGQRQAEACLQRHL